MLLKLLVVFIEFSKLIRQNVSVRHEIKVLFSIPLLHSNNVEAQAIFASDFMALREMVDLLILIKAFIEVALTRTR